ncbi:ATP-dependent DNA helicase RecG [Fructilactobacillus lindneri]|uniref:ATP-dependent DNA helicase RecG n=1 Tax=Fructilactobacillus lindneri TaxID=53444 RepID=UPI000CD4616B|nr:ATP-dependent DNA helicase RecG [Fructilactobacillus lindneri]POH04068.1 ATP-dependent DNA helicase RecG [Fructilactobacillus lindneri]POH04690.1 ATP-dependent DNA helicase RecG [Fructilactobacillus lindneri]
MKNLDDPISKLKGVGPKKQEDLFDLNIKTIFDLLNYFPFRYDDFRMKDLSQLQDQQTVTLKGKIAVEPTVNYFGKRRNRLIIRLLVGNDVIPISFFNQPWLKKNLIVGQEILVYGKFDSNRKTMSGIKIINETKNQGYNSIYSVNSKITQKSLKQIIEQAYSEYQDVIEDFVPNWIIKKYRLENLKNVIKTMHFPKSQADVKGARRTAKFNEFFLFQMRLQTVKGQKQKSEKAKIMSDKLTLMPFIDKLPYELTAAQDKVVNEILYDLHRPYQMNRLLQGDVGSGKTIVAALAILATVLSHKQAVMLAPTEILAEQHANSLAKLFKDTDINIALLTGDTPNSARKQLLPRIKDGKINLIVGTHALFQDTVQYHDLGLAVIDEQHRFGVNQRRKMREKGAATNVLSMTATPIPRTLSITTYGEMDISVIDELPGGRKPIKTTWIKNNQVRLMLNFLKKHLKNHEQAYVVVPLIDESDSVDMRNVTDTYEKFEQTFSPTYQVGLLHGQMNDEDKNQVMDDFKKNKTQILISTTVIEVGVDVSNASVMVIFDADHFGLAQLHQLRGRVGRGQQQSYCILIADPKNKTGIERMNVMSSSTDGFFISQKDLELRGPGDILGKQQSGIPNFKVGDPISDVNILSAAKNVATRVTDEDNWQQLAKNKNLVERLNAINNNTSFD